MKHLSTTQLHNEPSPMATLSPSVVTNFTFSTAIAGGVFRLTSAFTETRKHVASTATQIVNIPPRWRSEHFIVSFRRIKRSWSIYARQCARRLATVRECQTVTAVDASCSSNGRDSERPLAAKSRPTDLTVAYSPSKITEIFDLCSR